MTAKMDDAGRLRRALARRPGITKKPMFGGVCDAREFKRWIALAERDVSGLPAKKRR